MTTENKNQYTSSTVIKPREVMDKTPPNVDSKISSLELRILEQDRYIKKLQRDVVRLKDQISQIAGKLQRG
jgi:hypothetical protein